MNLAAYAQHLPSCNIRQDWSEAEMAMADTPEQYRDHGWQAAREELGEKMQTCTCGLREAHAGHRDELKLASIGFVRWLSREYEWVWHGGEEKWVSQEVAQWGSSNPADYKTLEECWAEYYNHDTLRGETTTSQTER